MMNYILYIREGRWERIEVVEMWLDIKNLEVRKLIEECEQKGCKIYKGVTYIDIYMPGIDENEKAFSWIKINGVSKAVRRIEITGYDIDLVTGFLGGLDSRIKCEDVMSFEIEEIYR